MFFRNRKAQITVELILISVVALILLLYIFNIFNTEIRELNVKKIEFNAREVGDKFANGINSAFLLGDGAHVNVDLPNKLIKNLNYDITIFPSAHIVKIEWNENFYNVPLITGNINNTNIQDKDINFTNVNGKIFIEQ
ncbi:hypothetical protein CL617_03300 [archaeon]|nr:hypothetical protein [archaeon]|tara:strand:- start:3618 stop:4031 length:414 start_codon:yes stop_codon:yes gene_type:complete